VDQVWRVCEIMGSPGSWVNKHGNKVGGGEWKEGIKLAQKLGFSFPKMAPHSLESVLPAPQWPSSLAQFVTWCLMWDPKSRPTSRQALEHEYFADAVDPLRPKSSATTRMLSRKSSTQNAANDSGEPGHLLSTKTSSWFRRSLPAREVAPPAVPDHVEAPPPPRPAPVHANTTEPPVPVNKTRPANTKRATWANGASNNAAPIPILPSIRPVSPLQNEINAQGNTRYHEQPEEKHKKIGRQLSVNSQGNHYADIHRQEAERMLNGNGLKSPTGSQKESFFSHLRKRARRLSGRHQGPISPNPDDLEANAGCAPWAAGNNRQSIPEAPQAIAPLAADPSADPNFADLDRALQSVRYSLDAAVQAANNSQYMPQQTKQPARMSSNPALKRHHSTPGAEDRKSPVPNGNNPISSRTRRSLRYANTSNQYDTPDEEDELLDEAINSAHTAARRLDHQSYSTPSHKQTRPPIPHVTSEPGIPAAYLTPSASKDMNGVSFGAHDYAPTKPVDIPPRVPQKNHVNPQWPTPPYDENDWASMAAASIFATQAAYR
jgi:meiosis induction protein kinase IME2/SME1